LVSAGESIIEESFARVKLYLKEPGLALVFGRRAGCHSICWMAPFIILGRKLRNLVGWPSLRLVASSDLCRDCQTCTILLDKGLPVLARTKAVLLWSAFPV
jgi:hypothetical protein